MSDAGQPEEKPQVKDEHEHEGSEPGPIEEVREATIQEADKAGD